MVFPADMYSQFFAGLNTIDILLASLAIFVLAAAALAIGRMRRASQELRRQLVLQESLNRQHQEIQSLLKEISEDITSLDINKLFQKITEKARESLKVDISDIRLVGEGGLRPPVGASGIEPDRLYKTGENRGRAGWIIKHRRPLVLADATQEKTIPTGDSIRELGVRGYLGVPLFARSGEVIGILRALTYEPREFSQSDVDLLQQLANKTAIALTNARLFEETEWRAREQEALNAIATATSQSLDVDEVLQTALDKVLEVAGREQGYIRLKDPVTGDLTLAAHRGISDTYVETLLHQRTPGGKSDRVFESGEPLIINDPEGSLLKEQTRLEGSRSMGWFPLKVKGRAVGIMNVSTTRPVPFPPREVELFRAIGNIIGVALENARLYDETKRNLRQVGALREIDQAITSTLDLRTVMDVLLEKIDLVLPYSATTVRLFNKKSGLLEPVACRNLDEAEWKTMKWRGGRGIPNVVFESKAFWMVRDVQADIRIRDPEFFRKHGLVSYLGVPLTVKDEILGVLGFYTKESHEFTAEEIEFLNALAGQAAVAIHNSQLYEETECRRREAEELARVAQSLTNTLDTRAVGERVVTSVRELFGVKGSTLRLLQPDGSLCALASSGETFSRSLGGEAVPAGMGLMSRAVAEGRPFWSADILNDPDISLTEQMRDYQLRTGNRSMIVVPLRADEKAIGTLALADQVGRTYSETEMALMQTFADQAALALENARLYEEGRVRERDLEETNRMLSALHSIAATTSRSLDLDWVLRAVIEKITEIFRFEATQIHVADERTDELLLGAYFETEPNRFAAVRSFKKGQGIVGKVAESGKPLIFEDAATDPLYRQLSHTKITGQFGFRFFAVFPIRGKQNSLGTLACTGAEPRKLSSEEIQLLEALADQIAVAIENSRLYEEIRKKVQELQRQTAELERANKVKNEFLSVMSHELRTPLSVIVGYVSMVKDGLYGAINPEQDKALEKVVRRANEQLGMINTILQATQLEADEIRLNIHEIRLGEFFADLKSGYEIPLDKEVALTWDYPSDLPVLKTDGDKLRHILQNLIGNAIKFTAKGSVTISARVTGINSRFVEFKVADTGIGISDADLHAIFDKFRQVDSSETRKYGGVGIGLYIVKTFVELLGGGIGVESEVAKGTTFTVRIPLPAETKAVRRDAEPHESKIEQLHQQ